MTNTDSEPLAALRSLTLYDGQVALIWFGQSSFGLRAKESVFLLDPFLSPHPDRLIPPPFTPAQARDVDAVLCTHEHLDHFDAEALRGIALASPRARLMVPQPIVSLVADLGIERDRIVGVQPGEVVNLNDLTIHPVPACHGVEVTDAYNFGRDLSDGLYRYLGYVIDAGARVYHAGDTIPYDGMESWLRDLHVDLALLPINGRSASREAQGLVGNMSHEEAARIAAAVGVDLLVPMHFDMFPANLGYPDRLVELVRREYQDLAVLLPARGRVFIYT